MSEVSPGVPRYPGAQPFSDDPISRKVFFGRERECRELVDQILANRLTVVYARSGAGKSSLLNAGVAPRLRELGFAPLIARVNDVASGPMRSAIAGVLSHAAGQGLEIIADGGDTLAEKLTRTEFWLGDVLLRPVLILDQFEELFTLYEPEAQDRFLGQLAELVRGQSGAVTVVLSMREDYVTYLEDAAGHLPRILDHRFRLAPLRLESAREALLRPAEVEDMGFASRPFRYEEGAIDVVLDYLGDLAVSTRHRGPQWIEPFYLQLICRHLEAVARKRQLGGSQDVVLTRADVGGQKALDRLLRDFFKAAVAKVAGCRARGRVRKLCVNHLISVDGRRVSLSEHEISERSKVKRTALDILVDARILRFETRAGVIYYELGHDAMIEPVLGLRRNRMRTMACVSMFISATLILFWVVSLSTLISDMPYWRYTL